MYIQVEAGDHTVLLEPEEFRSFAVRLGPDGEESLTAIGRRRDDHAWVSVPALHKLGTDLGLGKDWHGGADGMIAKAPEFGWVSADGTEVRAHIEIPAEGGE